MAKTYLNDNKSMAYPFYGGHELPFSMACIVGFGLCIRGEEPANYGPFVASSVSIAEDAINMAVGRTDDHGNFILIGTVYATVNGYSVYVPSTFYIINKDVESLQAGIEQALEAMGQDAGSNAITVIGNSQQALLDAGQVTGAILAYYKANISNTALISSTAASTGYMVLGTIPVESEGFYDSQYYLDPSCVTYMPDAVFGQYIAADVNGSTEILKQSFTLDAGGLVGFAVDGTTATLVPADTEDLTVDNLVLSVTNTEDAQLVTSINGHTISATPENPTPTLEFVGQKTRKIPLKDIIKWEWARWSYSPDNTGANKDTITLELNGTSKFPNCYEKA